MWTDIGKHSTTINKNGYIYSFYNRTCLDIGDSIRFYDRAGSNAYTIQPDSAASSNAYRACYFSVSLGATPLDGKPRILLYIPDSITVSNPDSSTVSYAFPLFETISPFVSSNGKGDYRLSWWSNVEDISKLKDINGCYQYDQECIKKFSNGVFQQPTQSSAKILCTADLTWRELKQSGGGITNNYFLSYPVVRNVSISVLIKGQGYVTDFAVDGGGGGLSVHSHTSIMDGGYAAAVFMPSAGIRPTNWR